MPLFTDGTVSSIEDLAAQDSAVLDVASTESINLTTKLSLAQEEIGVELSTFCSSLDSVVVSTPLRLWHAFHTLAMVYRDAYNSQLNDRYRGKRKEFEELAKWASAKLIASGVGVVFRPVPKAEPPELNYVPGSKPETTYYACVSWMNASGEEGAAGTWGALTVPYGNVLTVRAVNPTSTAAGWNVFVGLSPDSLWRQNPMPLDPGRTWLQTDPLLTAGMKPGYGQVPDYLRGLPRVMQRG